MERKSVVQDGVLLKALPDDSFDSKFWAGIKKIGKYAFINSDFSNKQIIVPKGVKLEDYAFFQSNISNVILPDDLEEIPLCAFSNSQIKSIVLPKNLKIIQDYAFPCNKLLTKIDIPDGVKSIGNHAFNFCSRLTNVKLPKTILELNNYAFANCVELKEVEFPSSLQKIGESSFYNCKSLKSIEVPENVKMRESAFSGCHSLNSVILNDGVKLNGDMIFGGCEELSKVKLPNDLKSIPDLCFKKCFSLNDIEFPKTLKSIGEKAFESCPLVNLDLPESLESIRVGAFENTALQNINVRGNTYFDMEHFYYNNAVITKSSNLELTNNFINITLSFDNDNLKDWINEFKTISDDKNNYDKVFIYVQKDKGKIILSNKEDEKLKTESLYNFQMSTAHSPNYYVDICDNLVVPLIYGNEDKNAETINCFGKNRDNAIASNTFRNYIDLNEMYKTKKIDKIPKFFLEVFPNGQLDNLYKNNNIYRFYSLVSELDFNSVNAFDRKIFMTDLFKIYYALGGFSDDISDRDMAYKYVLEHVATLDNENASVEEIGEEIHSRFSKLVIKNQPYNKVFADFFMKYYKDDKDFMEFFEDENGMVYTQAELEEYATHEEHEEHVVDGFIVENVYEREFEKFDFLCVACNNFDEILKNYPNMTTKGNTNNELLTPEFVAKHCRIIKYNNIENGNEELANLVGRYGYTQDKFEDIQEIFEKAKNQKENYVIIADKDDEAKPIQYEFLAKDDPRGFIIGDITNCCQGIGDIADSCVRDGFLNNNAGFLVFQKDILDSNGKPTGEKRIIGQAYIWYDPVTQTVCYDNIEIPRRVIKEIRSKKSSVKVEDFLLAIERSADSIIKTMNAKGKDKVKQVTTGEGYNDLKEILEKKYKRISENLPKNRNTNVYSDAECTQFVLRTYDQVTKAYADTIQRNIEDAHNCLQESIMQSIEKDKD